MQITELKKNVGMSGLTVSGKIKNIYQHRTGEGEYGPWSFQDLVITDDTGEMRVSLRNIEKISEDKKGQQVTFESTLNKKNEKIGVKIIKDTYKDKEGEEQNIIKIAVTPKAKITYGTPTLEPKQPKITPEPFIEKYFPPPEKGQSIWKKDRLQIRSKIWDTVYMKASDKGEIDLDMVDEHAERGWSFTCKEVTPQDLAEMSKKEVGKATEEIKQEREEKEEKEKKTELPAEEGIPGTQEEPPSGEVSDGDYEGYSEKQKKEYSEGLAKDYLRQIGKSTTMEELRGVGKKIAENKRLLKPDSNTLGEIYKVKSREFLSKKGKGGIPY